MSIGPLFFGLAPPPQKTKKQTNIWVDYASMIQGRKVNISTDMT